MREVTRPSWRSLDLGIAAQAVYDFMWNSYCDWYIEMAKPRPEWRRREREEDRAARCSLYVLTGTLKLLHPFMPFITEEVFRYLPGTEGMLIMVCAWPEVPRGVRLPAAGCPAWRA